MFADISNLPASSEVGVIYDKDHFGNLFVSGDGSLSHVSSILDSNETALLTLSNQVSVKLMDIGVYQTLSEVDEMFDFVNNRRVDALGEGLFSSESGVEELMELLTSLIANISKLQAIAGASITAKLTAAVESTATMSETADEYEVLYAKYTNLLVTLEQKLRRLQELNKNVTKLEVSTIAASALAKFNGDFMLLDSKFQDLELETQRQDSITRRGIDEVCERLAVLAGLQTDLANTYIDATDVNNRINKAAEALGIVMQKKDLMEVALDEAATRCANMDDYIKCLTLYESQILESGDNMAIQKEDKVFKIDAVAPEFPPCPEIIYITTSTTPIPTTTRAPRTTNPPASTKPPLPSCSSMKIAANGQSNWFFKMSAAYVKTLGSPNNPDVSVTNNNPHEVTVKLIVSHKFFADGYQIFRLRRDGRTYITPVSFSTTTKGHITDKGLRIEPVTVMEKNETRSDIIYEFQLAAGATATFDFYNSSSDWVFVSNAYAQVTKVNAIASAVINGVPTTCAGSGGIGGSGTPPVPPWCSPCSPAAPCFNDEAKTWQGEAIADGKPMYSENKYTTGKNSMEVIKFVLMRCSYEVATGEIFLCNLYTNSDMDNPFGIEFYDHQKENIIQWCADVPGHAYYETEDWQVAKKIYEDAGGGLHFKVPR